MWRYYYTSLYSFILIAICKVEASIAQCQQKVTITVTSLNFEAGCPFGDGGGMDPVLEVFRADGSQLYIMHLSNLNQITGPAQNVVTDFGPIGNPNTCPAGGFTTAFCLGRFDPAQTSTSLNVDIYEKDSNFFNPDCNGYNGLFGDSELGRGIHTFDFTQNSGTFDLGSCISFNYRLDKVYEGSFTESIRGPICPYDTVYVNGLPFYQGNSIASVTVPGINTCDSLYRIDLSFHTVPDIQKFGERDFCSQEMISIGVENDADYDTYIWSEGEQSESITVEMPGSYGVTVTTAEGCITETTFQVDTFAIQTYDILGNDSLCAGTSQFLVVAGNPSSQLWEDGSTNRDLEVSETGVYTVITTDQNGCSSESSIEVTVLPLPVITLIGNPEICQFESTSISVLESYDQYAWSTGRTNQGITIDQAGSYVVTVTDSFGCSHVDSITVIIQGLPVPDLSVDATTICEGESTLISLEQAHDSYAWSDGTTEESLEVNSTGTYAVTVTNTENCSNSDSIFIEVFPLPEPVIVGDLTLCTGNSGELSLDMSYAAVLWNDNSTLSTLEINEAGLYEVTVTDTNDCTGNSSINVTVMDQLNPQILGDLEFCAGQSTVLEVIGNYDLIEWSEGSTGNTLTISSSGDATVQVTDANGCTGSNSVTLVIKDDLMPMILGNVDFCQGEETTLSVDGNYTSILWSDGSMADELIITAPTLVSVLVTDTEGCTGEASAMLSYLPSTTTEIDSTTCDPDEVGTFTNATLNAFGCEDLTILNLVLDDCSISFDTIVTAANCPGDPSGSIILDLTGSGMISWSIIADDGIIITSGQSTIGNTSTQLISDLLPGVYLCILEDEFGNTEEFEISVPATSPDVSVVDSLAIMQGDMVELIADLPAGAAIFYWADESGPLCDQCSTITVAPKQTSSYFFYFAIDEDADCEGSFTTVVTVITNPVMEVESIYIPNIFSNTVSGADVVFKIFSAEELEGDLEIYDRWGKLVYSGTNQSGWNGFINNKPAEQGIYTYVLTVSNNNSATKPLYAGQFALVK